MEQEVFMKTKHTVTTFAIALILITTLPLFFADVPASSANGADGSVIMANGSASYYIKTDNSLWMWKHTGREAPRRIMDNAAQIFGNKVMKTDDSLWALEANPKKAANVETQIFIGGEGADAFHIVELRTDSSLWAWGENFYGQLGDGTTTYREKPVKIMDGVSQVSVGNGFYTMAIKTDGSLWAWGGNYEGQLGDGTKVNRTKPVRIMDSVAKVSAKYCYAMAIKTDGSLWGWGEYYSATPVKIMDSVAQIFTEENYAMAIKTDGSLWELVGRYSATPVKIMDSVARVSTGYNYTLALKTDGSLWGWGSNDDGQLGDGTTDDREKPVKIMNGVAQVSIIAYNYITAEKTDGSLWAWGLGVYKPVKIVDSFTQIVTERDYILAVRADGSLWAWGLNYDGQLGDGTTDDREKPVKIMDDVTRVSVGYSGDSYNYKINMYNMALKTDGSLWAWGNNSFGQLGDGTTVKRLKPVKIMDNVAQFITGDIHTIAVKTDGSLWTWGRDGYARLGDGTELIRATPVKIAEGVKLPDAPFYIKQSETKPAYKQTLAAAYKAYYNTLNKTNALSAQLIEIEGGADIPLLLYVYHPKASPTGMDAALLYGYSNGAQLYEAFNIGSASSSVWKTKNSVEILKCKNGKIYVYSYENQINDDCHLRRHYWDGDDYKYISIITYNRNTYRYSTLKNGVWVTAISGYENRFVEVEESWDESGYTQNEKDRYESEYTIGGKKATKNEFNAAIEELGVIERFSAAAGDVASLLEQLAAQQ